MKRSERDTHGTLKGSEGLLGGPVVKTGISNAEGTGLIPGEETKSHDLAVWPKSGKKNPMSTYEK